MNLHSDSAPQKTLTSETSPPQQVESSEAPTVARDPAHSVSGSIISVDPRQTRSGLSRVAFVLVMILAFFLAATTAQNSDFWLHLASGKALTEGQWGAAIFSYTSEQNSTINPTWLYDLLVYWMYLGIGQNGLILVKCFFAMGLGWSLVARGKRQADLLLPCLGAALALVALGPWLAAVKPICLSFFLLSLTLYFLERPLQRPDRPNAWLAYWPLFVIFPLWGNVDRWFLLGPATVGLYCLGSMLSARTSPQLGHSVWTLAKVFLIGMVSCLIRPHPWEILQFPPELASGELYSALRNDFYLREQFLAPFSPIYSAGTFFRHPAGLAFWTLTFVGLISFFLVPRSWPHILVWGAFFGLSLYLTLAVPFFAVVGGPLLAMNLCDALQPVRGRLRFDVVGGIARLSGVLGLLALAVAAWPGWLQPRSYGPRTWRVAVDPSLKKAAEQIARWRMQGMLAANGRGFHLTLETANFFAWHCNGEKGFVTSRLEGAVDEYSALRGALITSGDDLDWRAIFRKHRIDHVVLFASDQRLIQDPLKKMLANPKEWTLLHVGGKAVVLGWRDPQDSTRPDPFGPLRIDFEKLAFGLKTDKQAPREWPGQDPRTRFWWESFYQPQPTSSYALEEAIFYLNLFDILRPAQFSKNSSLIQHSMALSLVGSVNPVGTSSLELLSGVVLYGDKVRAMRESLDDGPVATLYLAIRAARQALAEAPDNAHAYLVLGEAYYRLNNHSRERVWATGFPLIGRVRTVQSTYGFTQAARLKPELIEAHARLSEIYESMDYQDLALNHYKAFVDHLPRARPRLQENLEMFEKRLNFASAKHQELARKVAKIQEKYEINSLNLRVVDRAHMAGRLGLAGKALKILLASDIAAFGVEGMELELKLLLNTGRVAEVREWMVPDHVEKLGDFDAYKIKALVAAAIGDYQQADQYIENMTKVAGDDKQRMSLRSSLALYIGSHVLAREPNALPIDRLWTQVSRLNADAIHSVLRGLLALESGSVGEAKEHFANASLFWSSQLGSVFVGWSTELLTAQAIAHHFLAILDTTD